MSKKKMTKDPRINKKLRDDAFCAVNRGI